MCGGLAGKLRGGGSGFFLFFLFKLVCYAHGFSCSSSSLQTTVPVQGGGEDNR